MIYFVSISSGAVENKQNGTTDHIGDEIVVVVGAGGRHDQIGHFVGAAAVRDQLVVEIAPHARHQVRDHSIALLIDVVQDGRRHVQRRRQTTRSFGLRLLLQMQRRLVVHVAVGRVVMMIVVVVVCIAICGRCRTRFAYFGRRGFFRISSSAAPSSSSSSCVCFTSRWRFIMMFAFLVRRWWRRGFRTSTTHFSSKNSHSSARPFSD